MITSEGITRLSKKITCMSKNRLNFASVTSTKLYNHNNNSKPRWLKRTKIHFSFIKIPIVDSAPFHHSRAKGNGEANISRIY